jgi:hypothetical protein
MAGAGEFSLEGWRGDGERHERTHAIINFEYAAAAPLGRVLLISKESSMCAIRFTRFSRGHDAKPGNVFHSGAETFRAEYEWANQRDGSGDFTRGNVQSGHGEVSSGATIGIGRLVVPSTSGQINCGGINEVALELSFVRRHVRWEQARRFWT